MRLPESEKLLDTLRLLCRGKDEAITELCRKFNAETNDGRDMSEMSELLSDAINSIMDIKKTISTVYSRVVEHLPCCRRYPESMTLN